MLLFAEPASALRISWRWACLTFLALVFNPLLDAALVVRLDLFLGLRQKPLNGRSKAASYGGGVCGGSGRRDDPAVFQVLWE